PTTTETTSAPPATETTKKETTTKAATTKTSTTKASSERAASAPAPDSPEAILNSAVLHPQYTNDEWLDMQVQSIFSVILKDSMSTYEKVVACYNYMIDTSEYGHMTMFVNPSDFSRYVNEEDAKTVLFAKSILSNGKGVCDDYAALFLVLTRAIGLDCYYTTGYTTNTKGEKKAHSWNTITVNGKDYIFDVQVEDNQSDYGIKYTFFCKEYDSPISKVYSGYDLESSKKSYGGFRLVDPSEVKTTQSADSIFTF
ncbi:MAG: transglutaminase domain-containing protein, partial [Clostridiales bacterium]|nr:transglutaminase domain-containing protein [Clostridiales bacterium]